MHELTREFLEREYWANEKSPRQIAAETGLNINRVRRELRRHWDKLRTRAEAQAAAIRQGRHKHPTKGQPCSDERRLSISRTLVGQCMQATDRRRRAWSEAGKKAWEGKNSAQRRRVARRGNRALQAVTKTGSRAERLLAEGLRRAGYEVLQRDVHADLLLPEIRAAVWVEGAPTYLPIWGEEALEAARERAAEKRTKARQAGFHVVRVRIPPGRLSVVSGIELLNSLLDTLKLVKDESEPGEYEIGVSDGQAES
jgi:hypothetical protein